MATFTADAQGIIRIPLPNDIGSFGVRGMDGQSFAPGATVEIDDERLARVIAQLNVQVLTVPIGVGDGDR